MASTSETGHAKNIANFQDLIFLRVTEQPTTPQMKMVGVQLTVNPISA